MADTADVEVALVGRVASALGISSYGTGVVAATLGLSLRLYRGWPVRRQLDQDLKDGVSHITVFPRPQEHNTTRYGQVWRVLTPAVHSVTASIAGTVVTLGGVVSVPQNVALVVNGKGYVHSVVGSDTLSSVASALASLVNVDTPASASGPAISISNAVQLVVRVGGIATAIREVKRQLRSYQVTCWCPTPEDRDALAGPLDVALSSSHWLTLADTTVARLRYVTSSVTDDTQKVGTFRRDLFYSAEFGTTETLAAPEIVLARSDYTDGYGFAIGTLEA